MKRKHRLFDCAHKGSYTGGGRKCEAMPKVVLLRSNPVRPDPPVEKVADALLAKGFEVTIVCWERGTSEDTVEDLTLQRGCTQVVRFGIPAIFGGGLKKNLKALATFQLRLFSWLKKNRETFDVIHSFDFDTGYVADKIATKYQKKHVYHILDFYVDSHGFSDGMLRKCLKSMEFGVINRADATIICTEKRREQIEGSKPKRLSVIHNTPKPIDLPEEIGFPLPTNERCKIVYVGILTGGRLIPEVMDLVKNDDRLELHIGGFGQLEDTIRQQAQQCSRIVFYGKLQYAQTLALERACDIMTALYDPCIINHRYAAPNKLYESLMQGKPVIMAKNTGFDQVILENEIGILIDYTPEGLKQGLEELLSKKSDWPAMSQRMKKLYGGVYGWPEMECRLLEIYEDVLGE